MRVIIAGSRGIADYALLVKTIGETGWKITSVISGGAKGVDSLGERYARENGIDLKVLPAEWEKHGRSAGYIRNLQMAGMADGLITLWDGQSRGTKHMIDIATKKGLMVAVRFNR